MKAALLGGLFLVFASAASAHRLDEYLQAVRIAVSTNHIDLSIDLTPGVAIVDQLLVVIDKDRDGVVSKSEQGVYAHRVMKDIQVALDDKAETFRIVKTTFPAIDEMKEGVGVIRIRATAAIEPMAAGNHTLTVTNTHLPAISVYLVNALVPKDPAISISKQTRDELQKVYRLEFKVTASPP